jgi:phage shock protein PspC (stress-responsive transcriptional regulator)
MQVNPRRLYRSRDRQLAGVAGGMAEYLNIDPTVARVLWILAAIFTGGLVILAYIVLAIITPENPYLATGYAQTGAAAAGWSAPPASPTWNASWAATEAAQPQAAQQPPAAQQARGRGFGAAAIVGVVLIVIGAIALADAALPGWSSAVILGPAVILALGAAIVVASLRRADTPVPAPVAPAPWAVEPAGSATPWSQPADPISTAESTDTQPVAPIAFG